MCVLVPLAAVDTVAVFGKKNDEKRPAPRKQREKMFGYFETKSKRFARFPMNTSKRIALLCLTYACMSGGVQAADWRRVGDQDPSGTTMYLDVDSPRREPGGNVVAALLLNYTTGKRSSNGAVYMSSTRITQFDCKDERLADQEIIFYSEPNAKGSVVSQVRRSAKQAAAALESADPQSKGLALVYAACEVYARGKPPGQ
jgi:hypothetical protein